jgi:TctA family transporter
MAKKEKVKEEVKNTDIKVKRKKKMTRHQKRALFMKIMGWFMAIVMIGGVIASFLSYFIAG